MTLLNIAEICPATCVLGPGKRFAIWVQGCCFNCPGCVAPDWIPQQPATLVDPIQLAETILSVPDIEGITISGGEPMLQATGLGELLEYVRSRRDLSIICFTGFTLPQLQAKSDPAIEKLLSFLDVLIDGLYISQLNDNRGWRGSTNQVIHFLTPRHLSAANLFVERQRDTEIHLRNESALMVGIPPHNFADRFHQAMNLS